MHATISPGSATQPNYLRLKFARALQAIIIFLTVGLFLVSIPFNYEQRAEICKEEPCPPGKLTMATESSLKRVGLSVEALVKITIAADILFAAVWVATALIVFFRKSDDLQTLFVSLMLVTFGVHYRDLLGRNCRSGRSNT